MQVRTLVQNGTVLIASTLIALAGCEVATRIFAPQLLSGSWLVIGPLGAYINKASDTSVHALLDRVVAYEFNSKHQRSRAEPDPKAIKVLVLGDSFTFGIGLNIEDTYVHKLQHEFDAKLGDGRVQMLNAGVGGSGTADQLTYLEFFGEALDLSAVVVFVSFDDFARALQRGIYEVSAQSQELVVVDRYSERSRLKDILEGSRTYEFLLEHLHLVQLVRNAAVFGGLGAINRPSEVTTDARREREKQIARLLFRRMAAWCGARQIQLTVLTTGWPMVDYPWLGNVLSEESIYFADLGDRVANTVAQDPPHYTIVGDGHPNERGASLIKDAAWPTLEMRFSSLPQER
jgi:hypothetical protein